MTLTPTRSYCTFPVAARKVPFPDLTLAKNFNHVFFPEAINQMATLERPTFLGRYCKVAQCMHQKGMIPLVHGQSASWMIPQKILASLGFKDINLLRLPSDDLFEECSKVHEQIRKDVELRKRDIRYWLLPHYMTRIGCFDHQQQLRDRLLAATVGLFHCEYSESALSIVFEAAAHKYDLDLAGNRDLKGEADTFKIQNQMIANALKLRQRNENFIQRVLTTLKPLYPMAARLTSGQILAIGIPYEQCDRFAFHCKPFGFPTGLHLSQILKTIEEGRKPSQGCQARFIFCKETMQKDSGIRVVNMMDTHSVKTFTDECNLPAKSEDQLHTIFPEMAKSTLKEERELLKREQFESAINTTLKDLGLLSMTECQA